MASEEFYEIRKKIIEKDFSSMNNMQRKAIFHVDGALLILAGAGSGKTTVLVNRIANLVKYGRAWGANETEFEPSEQDLENMKRYLNGESELLFDIEDLLRVDCPRPWQILAITFTNKAANELKERLEKMLGPDGNEVWASTFHSCCSKILRKNAQYIGFNSDFTIYDTDDQKRLMKECQRHLNIRDAVLSVKTILGEISRAKDSLVSPEEYKTNAGSDSRLLKIAEAYKLYQQELKKANAMDFDDIIFNTVMLLQNNGEVRSFYQRRFKYIMVDEYQDTNYAQFMLTKILAEGSGNICVVGDDDQSIYRFRGATIENIMNFEQQYQDATTIRLEQNYRSTQTILDVANEVISHNTQRKGKSLWTANGKGEKVTVYYAGDEQDEAGYIISKIEESMGDKSHTFSDHAVLYRMNAQSNSIERALVRAGIPYRIIGGFRFYERAEIRDAIAYLTVVNNPNDNIRLRRIINVPKRGIGDTTINRAFEIATSLNISLFEVVSHADEYDALSRCSSKLLQFVSDINDIRQRLEEMHLDELLNYTLQKAGYFEFLKLDEEKGEERLENIKELATNLVTYENESQEPSLAGFLEDVALMSDIDNYNAQTDAVVLMTMHSAKGLEFPIVFIPGMEEGIFPGVQSMYNQEDVEEERRLCYVGITRARQQLFITHARTRLMFGQTTRNLPSRFINEMPQGLLELSQSDKAGFVEASVLQKAKSTRTDVNKGNGFLSKSRAGFTEKKKAVPTVSYEPGDTVVSKVFGKGVVLSVKKMANDAMLEIAFETAGTKKLMANYARLEKQ